ncbi:MAG: hypothetical protein AAFY17_15220, partial [Cyanobacteria bacterium J06642_11]
MTKERTRGLLANSNRTRPRATVDIEIALSLVLPRLRRMLTINVTPSHTIPPSQAPRDPEVYSGWQRWLYGLSGGVIAAALYTSGSRGAWLGGIV